METSPKNEKKKKTKKSELAGAFWQLADLFHKVKFLARSSRGLRSDYEAVTCSEGD